MARLLTRIILLACLAFSASGCGSKGGCPSGQVQCSGACVDPVSYQTDANNCGACGVPCGVGATCLAGVCQCATGTTRCDALSPRCRDLMADPTACGSCSKVCSRPRESCGSGTCQCLAPNPSDCTTFCTNTQTDPQNCGAGVAGCGKACKPGASCAAGTCQCLAPNPDDCGALCTNRQTDPKNCGPCGTVCNATQTCVSGSCKCPTGPVAGCSGACCAGGTQCCTNACPTQHSNGLGQNYYDCNPLYSPRQTTVAAATAAADAWNTGTTFTTCDSYCLARQTGSKCAVWCYGISGFAGLVALNTTNNVCICPVVGSSPSWN